MMPLCAIVCAAGTLGSPPPTTDPLRIVSVNRTIMVRTTADASRTLPPVDIERVISLDALDPSSSDRVSAIQNAGDGLAQAVAIYENAASFDAQLRTVHTDVRADALSDALLFVGPGLQAIAIADVSSSTFMVIEVDSDSIMSLTLSGNARVGAGQLNPSSFARVEFLLREIDSGGAAIEKRMIAPESASRPDEEIVFALAAGRYEMTVRAHSRADIHLTRGGTQQSLTMFSDLSATLAYQGSAAPGDANLDMTVSFADITEVLSNYGLSRPDDLAARGDLNRDGAVNLMDVREVLVSLGSAPF